MSVTVPPPELPAEDRSALVIATGLYADPELARLRAPARDAADLAEVLGNPRLGAFEVRTLTDQPAHDIRVGVEDFLADRRHDELIVVYLSCHGVRDMRGRLYFAAADTRKTRLAATGVESGWLLDRLDGCRARRQVLILDCCFSGAFAVTGTKGEAGADLERLLVGHGRGRVVLTASRAGEYSFEGHALSRADAAGSVFTSGLVEGLRTGGADGDNDGLVSVEDAYDYAYTYVQDRSSAQTPQRWTYGAEGKIWLARNPAGRTITSAPPSEDPARVDGHETSGPSPAPELIGSLVTPQGRHALARLEKRRFGRKSIFRSRVDLVAKDIDRAIDKIRAMDGFLELDHRPERMHVAKFNDFAVELTSTLHLATALSEALSRLEDPTALIDMHALARDCRELADAVAANLAKAETDHLKMVINVKLDGRNGGIWDFGINLPHLLRPVHDAAEGLAASMSQEQE